MIFTATSNGLLDYLNNKLEMEKYIEIFLTFRVFSLSLYNFI